MNGCFYLFMCRLITSGWFGNYSTKVGKMHTFGVGVLWPVRQWHISDRGFSHGSGSIPLFCFFADINGQIEHSEIYTQLGVSDWQFLSIYIIFDRLFIFCVSKLLNAASYDGQIWHADAWRPCAGLLLVFMSIGVVVTKKWHFPKMRPNSPTVCCGESPQATGR